MSTPVTAAGVAKGRMCALVVGGTHPERQRVGPPRGLRGPALVCGASACAADRRGADTRQPFASGSVSAMSQSR